MTKTTWSISRIDEDFDLFLLASAVDSVAVSLCCREPAARLWHLSHVLRGLPQIKAAATRVRRLPIDRFTNRLLPSRRPRSTMHIRTWQTGRYDGHLHIMPMPDCSFSVMLSAADMIFARK